MTKKGKVVLYVGFFMFLVAIFMPIPALAEDNGGTVLTNGDVTIQQFQEEVLHMRKTEYKNYGFGWEQYGTTESYTTIYFMTGYALDHTTTTKSPTYGSLFERYYYVTTIYYYRTW